MTSGNLPLFPAALHIFSPSGSTVKNENAHTNLHPDISAQEDKLQLL